MFTDKVLDALVAERPRTVGQLDSIDGNAGVRTIETMATPFSKPSLRHRGQRLRRQVTSPGCRAGRDSEGEAQRQTPRKRAGGARPRLRRSDAAAPRNADELMAELRKLRAELAGRKRLPDFAIFPDYTLQEMVARRPQDTETASTVSGVLPSKLEAYGARFLSAAGEVRRSRGVEAPPAAARQRRRHAARMPALPRTATT